MNRAAREHGSLTLIAALFLLPLAIFVTSLSLDLSRYLFESESTQKILDDAALYAHRFLPFQDEAVQAARTFLSRHELHGQRLDQLTQVSVSEDRGTVQLHFEGQSPLTFAQFFNPDLSIPLVLKSVAAGTPFATTVVMDTSSYLAPPFSGPAWGDELEWPTAQLFQSLYYDAPVSPRLISQQCVNPVFAPLKRAAARVFEHVAASAQHAAGLLIAPGSEAAVEVARDTAPNGLGPNTVQFSEYAELYRGNTLCLAAAEQEWPDSPNAFPVDRRGMYGITDLDRPQPIVIPGQWRLNPEAAPYLTARELLWGQAARADRVADTALVLRVLRSQLVAARLGGDGGGLSHSVARRAVVLLGDVPHAAGQRIGAGNQAAQLIAAELEQFGAEAEDYAVDLELIFAIAPHAAVMQDGFSARLETFRQMLEGSARLDLPQGRFATKLVVSSTPQELEGSVLQQLLLERRSAVIAR